MISGIPQGSVLGPILFVLFINDMPEAVESLCLLFADDAKLFRNVNLRDEVSHKLLQRDIEKLAEWSEKWQLPFNTGKCKCLNIGNSDPCQRYRMKGQKLEQISEEKDLGVIVDKELKFHTQSAAATKKANSRLGIIRTSFAYIVWKMLSLLYTSLVRPHLEYGNVVWGPSSKGIKKMLKRSSEEPQNWIRKYKKCPTKRDCVT